MFMLSWLNEHLCQTEKINVYVKLIKWMFISCWADETNLYVDWWADKANVYVQFIRLIFILSWLN